MAIHVEIVSAEGAIFSGDAEMVFAPARAGEIGIAPRHAPLLTRIKPGSVRIKLAVARARKIQRFLSQPFHVAEVFTGAPGKYVPLKDTIKGFKGIVNGDYDHLPEQAFYMVGNIEEAVEKAKTLQ